METQKAVRMKLHDLLPSVVKKAMYIRKKSWTAFQWFAACLLAGALAVTTRADTSEPMFAPLTLEIKENTYTWVSATEDALHHYDVYSGALGNITVTGMIGSPDLATVSGPVSGHLSLGAYKDNYVTWSEQGSYVVLGCSFTSYAGNTTYYPDIVTGSLTSSSYESYSKATTGTYYTRSTYTDGRTEWSLSGSGEETLSAPHSGPSSFTLFGLNFTYASTTHSYSLQKSKSLEDVIFVAGESHGWRDVYVAPDGSSQEIYYTNSFDHSYGVLSNASTLTLVNPYWGYLVSSTVPGTFPGFDSFSWPNRPDPTYQGPSQIWVKAKNAPASARKLLTWRSGTVQAAGAIVDRFEGGNLVVEISTGSTGVIGVKVNGSDNGSYIRDPAGFTNTEDYQVVTQYALDNSEWISSYPFFVGATLWVDGTGYPFREGYQDASGTRVDVYENSSAGTVTLSGSINDGSTADVQVSHLGTLEEANYQSGDFVTYLFLVSKTPTTPTYGPLAWWVEGRVLTRSAPGANTYVAGVDSVTVDSVSGGASLSLTGIVGGASIQGQMPGNAAGLHVMNGTRVMRANVDGSPILGTEPPPEDFPPAVMATGQGMWRFLGKVTTSGNTSAAYYGSTAPSGVSLPPGARDWLLMMSADGSVTLTNLVTKEVFTGVYSTTSHLFQIVAGAPSPLPVRLMSVDSTNGALWGLDTLPPDLPPAFVVRGLPWRYAGTASNGDALYHGLYSGQEMTVRPEVGGTRLVTVADPVFGQTSSGTLGAGLNSLRLQDGTLVVSGTESGTALPVQHPQGYQIQTITGDLDVVGNNFSFGILQNDPTLSGALLHFSDVSAAASLDSTLSRADARWLWNRAASGTATAPVMRLNAQSGLSLQNPGAPEMSPTITLDPRPGHLSILPKLELTGQTADSGHSVITRDLGDARYLKSNGATGSINVNTGGSSETSNTVTEGAALGQNLQAVNGQVVVGRYNTPSDNSYWPDLFVVGAGTSAADTKNAVVVSRNGDTSLAGSLNVSGTTWLNTLNATSGAIYNLQVGGSLTVGGQPVMTTSVGDNNYLRKDASGLAWPKSSTTSSSDAAASGSGAMAFGVSSKATGTNVAASYALGSGAIAGLTSTSAGISTTLLYTPPWNVSGGSSFAIGTGAYAASGAFAIGNGARARTGNMALGNSQAYGTGALSAMQGASALASNSIAIGSQSTTQATATNGIALGTQNTASGSGSMSVGYQNTAGGTYTIALGDHNTASASTSITIGRYLEARHYGQVVVGAYNAYPETVVNTQSPTDPIFVVGNGTGTGDTPRSNAFIVKRNGDAVVQGTLIVNGQQTAETENSVLTRALGDARYIMSSGSNQGFSLTGGINVNTGDTLATANTVIAGGAAMGQNLQAGSGQVAVGRYNDAANTSALFVVGAGSSSSPKNALTVSSAGDTTLDGALQVNGTLGVGDSTFQFVGDSTTATLHSILARPQARWGWWRTETDPVTATVTTSPVMWLNEEHKLKLYPVDSPSVPAIVLDPAGNSSFKQPVRVPPGGDIPMGAFQQGDPP